MAEMKTNQSCDWCTSEKDRDFGDCESCGGHFCVECLPAGQHECEGQDGGKAS